MYLWVIFHPQKQVILQLFLAMLTGAVKVVLLLQLLLALFADVKEVDIGHCQLLSFRDLAQGPELNPGEGKGKRKSDPGP